MKSTQHWLHSGPSSHSGSGPFVDLQQPCDTSWLGVAAVESASYLAGRSADDLALELRRRVAVMNRVPFENVHLIESIDRMLVDLLHRTELPKICFPPSASSELVQQASGGSEQVFLARGLGLEGEIDVDAATDLPADGLVIVDSPSDPLGSVLMTNDAVRLARACQLVLVDERYGDFSNFTLRGLASEFHNIMVLRSYERWLGQFGATCGWAIASPDVVERFGMTSREISSTSLAAAIALLNDPQSIELTARLTRQERSRLYQQLRKFSFLSPVPSWGPFMSARVSIVTRADVVRAFLERGIRVHAPDSLGMEDFIRIGIGSRSAMERVRLALVDMGPELLG